MDSLNLPPLSENLRDACASAVDGWYPAGTRLDWDDVYDRVEKLADVDLGDDLLSPLVLAVRKEVLRLRRQ